jgi:hypothetical protein
MTSRGLTDNEVFANILAEDPGSNTEPVEDIEDDPGSDYEAVLETLDKQQPSDSKGGNSDIGDQGLGNSL